MKARRFPRGQQHQRKEAYRKEAEMPNTNHHETEDREEPQRAVIYLSETGPNQLEGPASELSIGRLRPPSHVSAGRQGPFSSH